MFFRKIKLVTNNTDEKSLKTLLFAARELQKYLRKSCNGDFPIIPVDSLGSREENTIFMGVNIADSMQSVKNLKLDDAIFIEVKDYSGIISGNNPRSLLIAVYRFLKEVGFYFLRPGTDGEIIPQITQECDVMVNEAAKNRHRGICMEGTIYQENLFDVVDWLPKVGFNSYFTQFKIPKVFLDRYYKVRFGVELTNDEMKALISLLDEEIEKRSLIYHAVGHGWTCEAFGVQGISWDIYDGAPLTSEQKSFMAQIDGKRELFRDIPTDTNLCYSQKSIRDKVTDNIVKYCKEHQNIDYLHFWLADGRNNNCECDNCKKLRVSDYYVKMLNELDAKLTAAHLDTKIAFLLYVDLLWAPLETKFNNPDRFIMMFAPISRSYTKPFEGEARAEKKEYMLNHNNIPESVDENIAYLRDWQEFFGGDSFDFDYHFMWDHYYDFSYIGVSEIMYKDICNFEKLKLGGLINCQLQRVFLPTGLGVHTCAQTLWNTSVAFDDITNEVLFKEYGENYCLVKDYLKLLHEYGCSKAVRGEENITSAQNREMIKKAIDIIDGFKETIEKSIESAELLIQRKYWEGLLYHGRLYKAMLTYYLALETDDEEQARNKMIEISQEAVVEFKDVFDASGFPKIVRKEMRKRLEKSLSNPK
ncbi:MAG: DUF4838 domain-containing protein [Lachnospiraceae bacterium]|nr:DUF4838 domain-containing protein [Lachnospiraceae bacterium]